MRRERYIFDALYGAIELPDFLWKTFLCPEFQRLREVRMCNINSLCLTGGANINRYEHCLGVAYLALQCTGNWTLKPSSEELRAIILAALLHDIGTTAFGHSVQYVLSSKGFEHQSFADLAMPGRSELDHGFRYRQTLGEPIYFGIPRQLPTILSRPEIDLIGEYVDGKGAYGPLISGDIDLDNIDNVYRLAYHIGLVRSGEKPLALARALSIDHGALVIAESGEPLLSDWFEVRRRLYNFLLLNPDEFSAKCMLQEALEIAQEKGDLTFRWNDVDFELLEKLALCSDETNAIVSRLAIGDLYGCVGIYSTEDISLAGRLEDKTQRQELEAALSAFVRLHGRSTLKNAMIAIHIIKDVNKTERQIAVNTPSGRQLIVGRSSRRILIGVFLKNVGYSRSTAKEATVTDTGVNRMVNGFLAEYLGDSKLQEQELYAELSA